MSTQHMFDSYKINDYCYNPFKPQVHSSKNHKVSFHQGMPFRNQDSFYSPQFNKGLSPMQIHDFNSAPRLYPFDSRQEANFSNKGDRYDLPNISQSVRHSMAGNLSTGRNVHPHRIKSNKINLIDSHDDFDSVNFANIRSTESSIDD